jgi:hypothetical protein
MGHFDSVHAVREGFVQALYGQGADLFEGILDAIPQRIPIAKGLTLQHPTDSWPYVLNGIEVRGVRGPDAIIVTPELVLLQELVRGLAPVDWCTILLENNAPVPEGAEAWNGAEIFFPAYFG